MKKNICLSFFVLLAAILWTANSHAQKKKDTRDFYEIRIYHFTDSTQEKLLDKYLSGAWLPALHKAGFKNVGVFKPIANDTSLDKRLVIFINSSSLQKLTDLDSLLQKDAEYRGLATEFTDAVYDHTPFTRMETILLQAFRLAPKIELPGLKNEKTERVYELRSYEGPTEKLYQSKVEMFNEGGEIALFKRLEFNAIFYAGVISGSRMPNLMYMTSFENKVQRDAHWKTFGADPEWKRLSSLPEYQHTVSKAEVILMKATPYSDL